MKFTSIFIQKFKFTGVLLLGVFIVGNVFSQTEADKKSRSANYTLTVVDQHGNPLPQVQVVIGDGLQQIETNANGSISLNAGVNDYVSLSKPGYEKRVSPITEISGKDTLILKQSLLLGTNSDNIPMPFGTIKKRYATGNSQVIIGTQLERYPANDLRNAFVGLAPGVEVLEKNGSPGLSAEESFGFYGIGNKVGVTARGRNMTYIIDDMPVDITELPLDPNEIESVTMVKDIIGKARFGPAAADGIIYIKTKRGRNNERNLNFNYEEGLSMIDRFPEWVSGTDYAMLNNQARINSGLAPVYSNQDIEAYKQNDPYNMFNPNVNFRNMLLKDSKAFRRANFSTTGGSETVQYTAYLGYNGEGDIYKMGPKSDYNRLNARSNLDFKVNDLVNVKVGLFGGLTFRRSPNYGYATSETSTATDLIEFDSFIRDINTTPAIAFPVYANNDPSLDAPWYAVSSLYKENPVANLTRNGYYTESGRIGASNVVLEYDMKNILSGLKSSSYVGINLFNLNRIGKAERHIAYIVSPTTDNNGNPTYNLSKVQDGVDASGFSNLHDFYTQRYVGYQNLNWDRTFGKHDLQSGITYYLSKTLINGLEQPLRQQNSVLSGLYTYNKRYTVQGVLNYAGSSSFAKGNRFALFPSIGASWILSEENFMAGSKLINYVKLRAEAGILGYDGNISPFNYQDRWNRGSLGGFGPHNLNRWFGTNTSSLYTAAPARTGNPDLTWEKRKEFSAGLDAMLLDNKLSLELTYYNNLREGIITPLFNSLPYVAGVSNAIPFYNYNEFRYYGLETGINFSNRVGKFKYSIGGNATIQNTKIEKIDEPNYQFSYQRQTGRAVDTYWGQTYLGAFRSDAEAAAVPQLFDAELREGDLKYKDMNGDGFVDGNDASAIGHTTPRLFYAITTALRYKNLDFTIIGAGRAFYDIPLTNNYFISGWGDNNYSKFIMENSGGAYPKQTYNKVNNNFVNSSLWLARGGYFKIQNIELAYTLPASIGRTIGSNGMRLYLRGANVLTFSKVKDVDPESIDAGVTSYPLFRTFTAGFKLNF